MKKNTLFQLSSLSLAIAISANVFALAPSAGTPDLTLYIPGSQSNDPAFGFMVNNAVVANAVCIDNATTTGTGTTTHIYFQAGINDNHSAIYCNTNDQKIPGLTTGDASNHHLSKLLIVRRRLGASFIGLDAVNHGTKLDYLDPTQSNAGCTASNGSYSSGGATYQYNYTCTTTTSNLTATAVTSDVTPDVFTGTNVTPGYVPINPSTISSVNPLGGHIVGLPVTLLLRNALQYAEVTTGILPSSCTPGNETAACVPTLTKEQVASIFNGSINDWTQFQISPTKTLADVVADGVTAGVANLSNPADTTVHICRRENGAGQQVALLASILQYPCLGTAAPTLADPLNNPNLYSDVQYATSLGAVDKCLTDYNNGPNSKGVYSFFGVTTNPSPYPSPTFASVPSGSVGNQWAISIQTTERNASNSAPYRFIAIDGAIPTGEEAYLGHYRLIGNYSLSWNIPASPTTYQANQLAALSAITKYSQLPSTIASRNGTLSLQSFGQAGYIALSDNGFVPPITWTASNPTTPYSKLVNGKPNACAIPTASIKESNDSLGLGVVQVQLK